MQAYTKKLNVADEAFSKKKAFGFALVRLGNILEGLMIGEITYFATNSLGLVGNQDSHRCHNRFIDGKDC